MGVIGFMFWISTTDNSLQLTKPASNNENRSSSRSTTTATTTTTTTSTTIKERFAVRQIRLMFAVDTCRVSMPNAYTCTPYCSLHPYHVTPLCCGPQSHVAKDRQQTSRYSLKSSFEGGTLALRAAYRLMTHTACTPGSCSQGRSGYDNHPEKVGVLGGAASLAAFPLRRTPCLV